jgi:superfamily II DNA or RNA helicase
VALIEGKMKKGDRDRAIAGLASGRHQILFSIDCVSEGVDVPIVGAGLMLRPTASTGLYLQQIGRLRRIYPGKDCAVLLDMVGNWSRHGMPNAERTWSLTEGVKGQEKAVKAVRRCSKCHFVSERGPERCANCNRKYPVPVVRPGVPSENQLAAMPGFGSLTAMQIASAQLGALLPLAKSRFELERIAAIKAYRKGWVDHVLRERAMQQYGARR